MRNYSVLQEGTILQVLPGVNDPAELAEIKRAGIRLGSADILDVVVSKSSQELLPSELEKAVKNAIGRYGFTIDDVTTSPGKLYQRLYDRDFENQFYYHLGIPLKYSSLSREMKDQVNRNICEGKKLLRFN